MSYKIKLDISQVAAVHSLKKKILTNRPKNIFKTTKPCPFSLRKMFLTRKTELCSGLLFPTTFSSPGLKRLVWRSCGFLLASGIPLLLHLIQKIHPARQAIHILYLKRNSILFKRKNYFAKEIVFPVNNLSPEWHQGELEHWRELGALVLLSNLWATNSYMSYISYTVRLMLS